MKDNKIALFDMDGTLFDYETTLRKDLLRLASPTERVYFEDPNCDLWDESKEWLKARIDLIKNQPGWWRDLPILTGGLVLWEEAKGIGFLCKILTKGPRSRSHAWAEKVECIDHHLGQEAEIDIVGGYCRPKAGTYGRVLVDDYPQYMEGWLENRPRGLGIMPVHKYNESFSHENVIKYDGYNIEEVATAMNAAFNRPSNQHWRDYL